MRRVLTTAGMVAGLLLGLAGVARAEPPTTTTTTLEGLGLLAESVDALTGWVQVLNGGVVLGLSFLVFLLAVHVVASWRK